MLFIYGDKMPLRILDEADFWKQQEAEHTVVIRQLVNNLEPRFVRALQIWGQMLERTRGAVRRMIEFYVWTDPRAAAAFHGDLLHLVDHCLRESRAFIHLLDQLGVESPAMYSNPTVMVVLNHIRRESEYFIGVAQAILASRPHRVGHLRETFVAG
ncbi:DUF2935 domain-containing protein [Kyrpidia sp.]|uniref:DUF2935 domain-containing protein n=1 Tax=Kyrpidia sp. TaxID=2073077 RepID=UPI0025845AD6|nr:DUF2935 domain-containing protein [Kyrpidia sp.]MCL6576181.1 DUF2935 domain-containing protein [Kyrpidia sp.]